MLRTIFVLGLMAIGSFYALQSAFYALLLYLWVAYFRPESWVWAIGFINSLNLSLWVGVYLILRAPFSDAKFRIDKRSVLLFVFLSLVTLSTATSSYVDVTSIYFQDFVKVIIVTYLLSSMTTDVSRVRLVLIVISMSLGFESAKQGWATLILHPGGKNENAVAMLGDENETAVGLLMLVPVMLALAQTATGRWERRLHQFVGIGVAYRAISTYSRGGFLSAATMACMYVARSKYKVRTAIVTAIVGGALLSVLPDAFWERMSTITVEEDQMEGSAASRPHFWRVAVVMANAHPMTGVGVFGFQEAYNQYDFSLGRFGKRRAVHSAWFGVVSEVGYPGLLVFATLVLLGLIACESVIRRARRGEIPPEFQHYAVAIETGLVVFIVGGSFVTFQYREILWHFIGISMALRNAATTAAVVETPAVPSAFVHLERGFGAIEPVRRRA